MRFFDTSVKPLTLGEIEAALRQVDPAYRVECSENSKRPCGDLYRGEDVYAALEINVPGDGLFNEEIAEMLEFLEDADGEVGRVRVESVLREAQRTLSVQVLWQERETDQTLATLMPLWDWLFATRPGLLQADGEGYYAGDELVLKEDW
jgi:hypothetical protein